MPHSYVHPANYCTPRTGLRTNVFEDTDLTSGAARFYLESLGGPFIPDLSFATGTSLRLQPVGIGGFGLAWSQFNGDFLTDGLGGVHGTGGANTIGPPGFSGSTPWLVGDVDMTFDVKVGTTGGGMCWRYENENQCWAIYASTSAARVVLGKRTTATTVVMQTGTTPLTVGVTYTIRFTCIADVWTMYVNGVQQGAPVTDTALNTKLKPGLYALDSDTIISNIRSTPLAPPAATAYQVQNFAGTIVSSGTVSSHTLDIDGSQLVAPSGWGPRCWYQLTMTGPNRADGQYNDAYGDCTFLRVATNAAFPANESASIRLAPYTTGWDEPGRTYFGLGPTRLSVENADNYTASASYLKTNYRDFALASRPRHTIGAFPDDPGTYLNVTAKVASLPLIDAWEPRNEPQATAAATFVAEQADFYAKVKAGNPSAIVLGPNPVTYNDNFQGYPWLQAFFTAGGAAYLDGLSVHGYNCTNGDIAMSKSILAQLKTMADAHSLPLWQTEQSFFYDLGDLQECSHPVRWLAIQLMTQECYGIPLERNVVWYDVKQGFDSYPSYWLNANGPSGVPLMVRTMVAELGNRTFDAQYDLGYASDAYVCARWNGSDGSATIGVLAQSEGLRNVRFNASTSLTAVDAWGNTSTLTPSSGIVTVPAGTVPTWVRVPSGVTVSLVSGDWPASTNLVAGSSVATTSTGPTYNPLNLADGDLENGYRYSESTITVESASRPYATNPPSYPHTITATLPTPQTLARVLLYASQPWQTGFSTLTDFDIDISANGSTWTTIYTQAAPASTTRVFTTDVAGSRTSITTNYNPRTAWDVSFAEQTVSHVRLVVRASSFGMHETGAALTAAWGSTPTPTSPYAIVLRDLRGFADGAGPAKPTVLLIRTA